MNLLDEPIPEMPGYVCAGFHRSGSTWLYNAMRLACELSGARPRAGFVNRIQRRSDFGCFVVKTHDFFEKLLRWPIYTTSRDVRDATASAIRMNLIRPRTTPRVLRYARNLVAEYSAWAPHSRMEVRYERLSDDPVDVLRELVESMGLEVDAAKLHRELSSLHPRNETDPISLLHPNHITGGGWSDTLTDEEVDEIEADSVCSEFLDAQGYER